MLLGDAISSNENSEKENDQVSELVGDAIKYEYTTSEREDPGSRPTSACEKPLPVGTEVCYNIKIRNAKLPVSSPIASPS
ncbi:UNVERIFIED_CONTAM: hypothetical protein FKN15_012284 [Acipenser sinensis]